MTASVASNAGRASGAPSQRERLLALALEHRCNRHELFTFLDENELTVAQSAALLRNYDAHAGVLRRLLLKAASIMPETAAGFILENVRNEYGNGDRNARHQLQLLDLALAAGVTQKQFEGARIEEGVRQFIKLVTPLYYPLKTALPGRFYRPAVAAGAITATEILALEEFRHLQAAFGRRGLANHVWFDHINVEAEHTDESLALALHFIEQFDAAHAVEFGMQSVLEANCRLYDGLLAAIRG